MRKYSMYIYILYNLLGEYILYMACDQSRARQDPLRREHTLLLVGTLIRDEPQMIICTYPSLHIGKKKLYI